MWVELLPLICVLLYSSSESNLKWEMFWTVKAKVLYVEAVKARTWGENLCTGDQGVAKAAWRSCGLSLDTTFTRLEITLIQLGNLLAGGGRGGGWEAHGRTQEGMRENVCVHRLRPSSFSSSSSYHREENSIKPLLAGRFSSMIDSERIQVFYATFERHIRL